MYCCCEGPSSRHLLPTSGLWKHNEESRAACPHSSSLINISVACLPPEHWAWRPSYLRNREQFTHDNSGLELECQLILPQWTKCLSHHEIPLEDAIGHLLNPV